MSIAQVEKIQDYCDKLAYGIGFDSKINSIKLKKVAIRSPLFDSSKIDTQYTTNIDWLQGTITLEAGKYFDKAIMQNKADSVIDDLMQLFSELIPNQDWDDKFGKFCYGKIFYNRAVSSDKILLMYNLPDDIPEYSSDKPSILFSIPGNICQKLEFRQILGLMCYLESIGKVSYTRCDIALDDYSRSISYDMISSAISSGGVRGYKSMCKITTNLLTTVDNMRYGWSFTFGDNSDKELQIYDKQAESQGVIPSIRFEARLRDDRSNNFVRELLNNFDIDNYFVYLYNLPENELSENFINQSMKTMAGAVNGCISFIESGQENKRKSRCKLLDWWQNHLQNTAKSIKIKSVSRGLTALPDKLFNMIRCAKSITKVKRFFDSAKKRINHDFTFESFVNLISCIGSGRISQADNLEVNNWLDIWSNSSESFDKLLEYSGVYQA